jgi:hypothetical protein
MMRIDLLRDLRTESERAAAGRAAGAKAPQDPRSGGGPLKRAAFVLLTLLVLAAVGLWIKHPEWINVQRVTSLWTLDQTARQDSLRAAALREKVSRVVEARQTAAIEWLATVEALSADPHQAGPVTFSSATFTAAGAFSLEGVGGAEAVSALQEALVLVPGLELLQSRATEVAGQTPPAFSFHLEGRLLDSAANGADTADSAASRAPVRPRIVPAAGLAAHLDTLLRAAADLGITLAPPRAGNPGRQGALSLHAWHLKGYVENPVALRTLWEQERHRGSPFAVQRVTVSSHEGKNAVFLDIVALSP